MANKRFRRPAKPARTRDALTQAARWRERMLKSKKVDDVVREKAELGWVSEPTKEAVKKNWHQQVAISSRACPYGLTGGELAEVLGDRLAEFHEWMVGQTVAVCDGREFNHGLSKYEPTVCADSPHGLITYVWDVQRFLEGRPVVD